MRTLLVFGTTLVFSAATAGCIDFLSDDQSFRQDGTGGATGSSGTGGNGGAGGLPDECQGDPTKDTALARDQCGVFVDAAAVTNGNGTRAAPYKTIADAAKTNRSRIFICSGAYSDTTTVELLNGVEVYGGFTQCEKDADWQWNDGSRASLTGPANVPALWVRMGQTLLRNLDVTAPDATAAGGSSIAVVADSVVLDLQNVELHAGTGADGADGAMPSTEPEVGQSADSSTVTNACDAAIFGGKAGTTVCDDGDSAGGDGGKGGMVPASNGEAGTDGTPAPEPNDGHGLGGVVKIDGTCGDGGKGKDGELGAAGMGAGDNGSLTAKGIAGGAGEDGKAGRRARGGGGGGGAKAGTFCVVAAMTVPGVGASGGGGGSGGCGGKGGKGGAAGGSSIAVVSSNSTFTFAGVRVRVAAGGDGGSGGLGKPGAPGGAGASGGAKSGLAGSKVGCAGGGGGTGGKGGRGGGGRGGHSLGIAFVGATPPGTGITFEPGDAGAGGAGDLPDGNGAAGTAAATLEFEPN